MLCGGTVVLLQVLVRILPMHHIGCSRHNTDTLLQHRYMITNSAQTNTWPGQVRVRVTQIHIFWRTSKCIVVVQLAIGSGRIRVNCHIPGRDNSRSLALVTVWF